MNTIVFGDCEKHDFVLTAAALLHAHTNQKVTVVTDEDRNYRYFDGEVSGVKVDFEVPSSTADIVIYDYHYGLPDGFEKSQILLASSFERPSIESNINVLKQMKDQVPMGLLLIESDGKIKAKYVEKSIPVSVPIFTYFDDPGRKIELVHDGRINYKTEKGFAASIEDFLTTAFDVPDKEMKKIWAFVRKRG